MPEQASAKVKIRNRLGMHARPAMVFVEAASEFECDITLARTDNPGEVVDGKSIMQVMMLAATQGTELSLTAKGERACEACKCLAALIERGFDEA